VTGSSAKLGAGYIAVSNCTLVHTAEGPMLFGGVRSLARSAGRNWRILSPKDITRVFLYHLHHDHSLNIDMFPKTTKVFVSKAEWSCVCRPPERTRQRGGAL